MTTKPRKQRRRKSKIIRLYEGCKYCIYSSTDGKYKSCICHEVLDFTGKRMSCKHFEPMVVVFILGHGSLELRPGETLVYPYFEKDIKKGPIKKFCVEM